jgi:hypothetical protein
MSKAFKGLALSDFRKQACGHAFNAAGCKVCPYCRVYLPHLKRSKAAAPKSTPSAMDKAVAALCVASDGLLDSLTARIEIERILEAHRASDLC